MALSTLDAINPIDGRYRRVTDSLSDYFSERALIKYRTQVEIEYFIALYNLPLPQLLDDSIDEKKIEDIRDIYRNFSIDDAKKVKEIEKVYFPSLFLLYLKDYTYVT